VSPCPEDNGGKPWLADRAASAGPRRRFWSALLACLGLLLAPLVPAAFGEGGLPATETSLLVTAAAQIRDHALAAPKSSRRLTEEILRAYTHSLDPYSDYLSAGEYAAFLESTRGDYAGVEMDLQKRDNQVLVFPFKDGLAERSGIRAGDELIAVNGAPIFGKSVYAVGVLVRGPEGATVQLTLRSGQSLPRTLSLRRQRTSAQSVTATTLAQTLVVRIARFTDSSQEQLRRLLTAIDPGVTTLMIDLRRNQGGSLISARQCAELFVDPGTILFQLRDREGIRQILAEQPRMNATRLVLLQDRGTASAAEAFISALTSNRRALAVGETTFGKGLAQRFLPLADGSALLLTYAEILTSAKAVYHGQGLAPDIALTAPLIDSDYHQQASIIALLDFIALHQK